MPCDIGYKEISRIRVEPKLPQVFKEKAKAPAIDKELLDNLGVSDTEFLQWAREMDINPLLNEALKKALKATGGDKKINFSIENGELIILSQFNDAAEKKAIQARARSVSERLLLETLNIIARLLDYDTVISQKDGTPTVEGEKFEESNVHKYLRISVSPNGQGVLMFEHFSSENELTEERSKFLLLAKKLKVKIGVSETHKAGQPIPQNVHHHGFLKETN